LAGEISYIYFTLPLIKERFMMKPIVALFTLTLFTPLSLLAASSPVPTGEVSALQNELTNEERQIMLNDMVIRDFGTASDADYARTATPISSKGISAPFMVVDTLLNAKEVRTLVVGISYANNGLSEYQAGGSFPTGVVTWPSSAKPSMNTTEWLVLNSASGNITSETPAPFTGSTNGCLAGNAVIALQQSGISNTLNAKCFTLPPCATTPYKSDAHAVIWPGVITADNQKYCHG
jgi:hypothetical protein